MLLASCGGHAADALRAKAPGIPRELCRLLAAGDDAGLSRYAESHGYYRLTFARSLLVVAYGVGDPVQTQRIVDPAFEHITKAMAAFPTAPHDRGWMDAWRSLSARDKQDVARMAAELKALQDNPSLYGASREASILALRERFMKYPAVVDLGGLYACYADFLVSAGRDGEVLPCLRAGIDLCMKYGQHRMACHLLGVEATVYGRAGDFEAMHASLREGLLLARHCHPDQEARLLSFLAMHYRDMGFLTVAHDLLRAAEEVSEASLARGTSVRYYTDLLTFHADLGCWDVVRSDLERSGVLLRRARHFLSPEEAELWSERIAIISARHELARGHVRSALSAFDSIAEEMSDPRHAPELERFLLTCGTALVDVHRYADARRYLARCLTLESTATPASVAALFRVQWAEVAYALGDMPAARATLDDFALDAPELPLTSAAWIRHDALLARLAHRDGDNARTLVHLQSAVNRLCTRVSHPGSNPAELIQATNDLHRLAHTLVAGDADRGVALELMWRRAIPRFGAPGAAEAASTLRSCLDVVRGVPGWNAELTQHRRRLRELKAEHCVFGIVDDRLIRWSLAGEATRCDTIPADLRYVDSLVTTARSELLDGVGPARGGNHSALRALAVLLLPAELQSEADDRTGLVMITPAGPLADLPFEALDVGDGAYTPLIERRDVSYARSTLRSTTPTHAVGGGIIVADPLPARPIQRRYPQVARPLAYGEQEAAHLAASDRSARVLARREATKAAIMNTWERARYLYFASHVFRDSELPYLTFIPVSEDSTTSDYASFLIDAGDIRDADLSGCRLVVLSGCSSGEHYPAGRGDATALSDAFLDAGCGNVIQTFWDIDDRAASQLMKSFIDAWSITGKSPLRALNDVRRESARSGEKAAVWAAYGIVMADGE